MNKEALKNYLINWILNDANEEQLEGLEQIIKHKDYNYGIDLLLGDDYNEYVYNLKND